jgi:glycosyltransferase involved in cell wall biosynthesis
VSQEYPEETGWGGIGTYTYEMAHGLAQLGHRVVVVARANNRSSHKIEADGVEVYRLKSRFDLSHLPGLWRLNHWWEGYRLTVALVLRELVSKHKIDLIETPELHAETLAFSWQRWNVPPIVIRLHGGVSFVRRFDSGVQNSQGLETWLERQHLHQATFVTAPSHAMMTLSGDFFALSPKQSCIIPNPINPALFPASISALSVAPQVLFVGRPRLFKGIHILAQAMRDVWLECPEAELHLIGTSMGKTNEPVEVAFQQFLEPIAGHPRVHIIPPMHRQELPDHYARATVCVFPSLFEPFGYTCLEAMACGRAVVASRVGGLAEMVEDGVSGLLVDPDNPTQLAQAIVKLLKDATLRADLGQAARQRVEHVYRTEKIATQMAKLYEEIINRFHA